MKTSGRLAILSLIVLLAFQAVSVADTASSGGKCSVSVEDCSPYTCLKIVFDAVYSSRYPTNTSFGMAVVSFYERFQEFRLGIAVSGKVKTVVNNSVVERDVSLEEAAAVAKLLHRIGSSATTSVDNISVVRVNATIPTLALIVSGKGYFPVSKLVKAVAGVLGSPTLLRAAGLVKPLEDILVPIESAGVIAFSVLEAVGKNGGHELTIARGVVVLVYPPYEALLVLTRLKDYCVVKGSPSNTSPLLTLQPLIVNGLAQLKPVLNVSRLIGLAVRGDVAGFTIGLDGLCSSALSAPDMVSRLNATQVSSLAALCSLEPIDNYGLIYSVDLFSYSYLLARLVAEKLEAHSPKLAKTLVEALLSGRRLNKSIDMVPVDAVPLAYYVLAAPRGVDPRLVIPGNPVLGDIASENILKPSNITSMASIVAPIPAKSIGGLNETVESKTGGVFKKAPGSLAEETEELRRMLRRLGVKPVSVAENTVSRSRASSIEKLIREFNASIPMPRVRYGGVESSIAYSVTPDPTPLLLVLAAYIAYLARSPLYSLANIVRGLLGAIVALNAEQCYTSMLRILAGFGYGRMVWEGPLEHLERLPREVRGVVEPIARAYIDAKYAGKLRVVYGCTGAALELAARALRLRMALFAGRLRNLVPRAGSKS